ncbi:Uma2 family endonuclease [Methylopila sp. 73B]|uniref:Uma2 family endonuclease n=1 Tax=Methylopila sp. 73B TaxID=1120792 RepID=UPI0003738FDA|nr:Uma2 family endonuclease [Methylopila sp. 73B]
MNVRYDDLVDYRSVELQPGMAVPVEVFLDWIDTQEGKYEYDRGTIGMMVKVTRNHSLLGARFVYLLSRALEDQPYEVHAEAFGVRTDGSIRFPDVLVQRPEADGRALDSKTPLLIVEVLSPSSVYADHVVKRDEYLALPTLQAYVVADANSPKLTLWERGADGAFPAEPVVVAGLDAELRLAGLAVALPLARLYRGIIA